MDSRWGTHWVLGLVLCCGWAGGERAALDGKQGDSKSATESHFEDYFLRRVEEIRKNLTSIRNGSSFQYIQPWHKLPLTTEKPLYNYNDWRNFEMPQYPTWNPSWDFDVPTMKIDTSDYFKNHYSDSNGSWNYESPSYGRSRTYLTVLGVALTVKLILVCCYYGKRYKQPLYIRTVDVLITSNDRAPIVRNEEGVHDPASLSGSTMDYPMASNKDDDLPPPYAQLSVAPPSYEEASQHQVVEATPDVAAVHQNRLAPDLQHQQDSAHQFEQEPAPQSQQGPNQPHPQEPVSQNQREPVASAPHT